MCGKLKSPGRLSGSILFLSIPVQPQLHLSLLGSRNRNNMKMQELKEAVGVESRTTILNPVYIKEKMKGIVADEARTGRTIIVDYLRM